MSDQPRYARRTAVELGWLLRSDLGTDTCDVWEEPGGEYVAIEKGLVPIIYVIHPADARRLRGAHPPVSPTEGS